MKQEEKMAELAEVFEVDAADLKPETTLESLRWDSMAMLSVIAMLKNRFAKKISGSDLRNMKTVQDLLDVMS